MLKKLENVGSVNDLPYQMANASVLLQEAELAVEGSSSPNAAQKRRTILDQASEVMEGVLRSAGELAPAHLLNGRIREARGRLDEAIFSYRKAWQLGSSDALPRLTNLLAQLRRFDELEQLANASGTDSNASRQSAQSLINAGEIGGATRLLNDAVNDPNAPAAANSWRARMLELSGQTDALEELLRRQADRAPNDDATPWVQLVATQAQLGRDQAALEVTIRRAMEHAFLLPAPLLEAQLRWAIGDVQAADSILDTALQAPDVDPLLLITAASFFDQTGRPDRAEPLLEQLVNVENVGDKAALQLAMVLSARSTNDPETWERALSLVGTRQNDPEHRLALAVVLSRSPDPDRRAEAIPLYESLIADLPVTHPRAIEARNQLTQLLIDSDQPERAVQLTAISASQPAPTSSAIALHIRALLLVGRTTEAGAQIDRLELLTPGEPEVAELRVEQILKANNGSPTTLEQAVSDRLGSPGGDIFARAAALRLLGTGTPETLDAADLVAEQLANDSSGRSWVAGLVLAVRGQWAEALDRCAEAVGSIDLSDGTDRIGMTDAILRAVQAAPIASRDAAIAQARPIIDEMLERREGDPDLLIASAVLHRHAGEYSQEAELYRQALQRRPNDSMARYNLALVLSEGLNQPKEALEEIQLLAKRIGPVAPVLGARGVILTRLEQYDEAIKDLERSLALEPTADRHYYLARTYHKAGQDKQFREHLEQAQQAGLDPNAIDRWQQDELQQLLSL